MDAEKQEQLDFLKVCEAQKRAKCKHKFKPRYTETYSSLIEEKLKIVAKTGGRIQCGSMPWQAGERTLKEKRYIHDVCVKCGMIVKGENNG